MQGVHCEVCWHDASILVCVSELKWHSWGGGVSSISNASQMQVVCAGMSVQVVVPGRWAWADLALFCAHICADQCCAGVLVVLKVLSLGWLLGSATMVS
jgi:hypothetical protein